MLLFYLLPFLLFFLAPNIKTKVVAGNKKRTSTRESEYLFWILFVFSISFIWQYGLRDGGGADDAAYQLYYERNYGGGVFDFLSTDKEPLFNLLKTIGYSLGLNYKFMFLGYAVIDLGFLLAALKNYYQSKADLVIYIAGFYFIAFTSVFTTMRQSAVMAMLFYLYSLNNASWKKRIIMWALMVCSHYGFLILLPLEILVSVKRYRFSNVFKIVVPCICLVAGNFVNLGGIIQKVTGILGLYSYMNDSGNYTNDSNLGVVIIGLFLVYVYLLVSRHSSYISDNVEMVDKISYGNMMYFSIMFLTARLRWGNRLGYYYLFTIPMLITMFYDVLPVKKKGKLVRYSFVTLLYIGFIIVMESTLGESGYVWSLNFKR